MFTAVIPLFDKAATIQRAVDSVAAQTFAPAEILIVNDGSTDGGEAIARQQANVRVRVIDQPNRGVSAARNTGLREAAQPFVAFLDADDRWRPAYLARMRDLIARHPGGVLYGAGFFTVEGDAIKRYHGIGRSATDSRPAGVVDFFAERLRDFPLHTSTTIVARDAALAVGGFPEGVAFAEDHLFWAKLALAGPVVLTPEPLAEYDVAVPGQAIEYWQHRYRERFDILDYHRFLAAELHARMGSGEASDSFALHARQELRTAVLQRAYWGRFDAVAKLWNALDLGRLGLGPLAAACAWASRQSAVQPVARSMLAGVRSMRCR
jgi:glycosyltransferase involved in cell wall biosynthesis